MTAPVEKVNGTPATVARPDPMRLAEAEAIRIKAQGEADAARTTAAAQAEKLRLANERAAMRLELDQVNHWLKLEKTQKERDDLARTRAEADRAAEQQRQAEAEQAEAVDQSARRWRRVAKSFYVLCAAVALPVQMTAFYDPNAKYLLAAPLFIEVIALVALVGAAAAVIAGRPHWHYRVVAWAGALTAAGINVVHGLQAFDPATAFGTALASVAGPGMWDLHEHGRIRSRDGAPTRRQRRAAEKAAHAEADAKAAEDRRRAAEREAADKAAAEARTRLDKARAEQFPKVWEHAVKLAAALGERAVTEAVWRRAHRDVEGADPGESADVLRARNAAERRVEAARTSTPVHTVSKTTTAQRANQMPRTQRGPARTPPVRRPGDTQRYVAAARRQASIAAKNAAEKDPR